MLTQNNSATALLKNYSRYPVEFVKGEGAYLYDSFGNEYLDFLSGIAVTGFGHNHSIIKEAVENQVCNLWHVSNLFEASQQELLAQKLINNTELESVFFCNSGTEANEAAIKFARNWGEGRSSIITTLGSFHGRTMGSLSASGQYKLWRGFYPLTPGFVYVDYNDVEAIKYSITEHTVAVMVEPIQGESGIIVPAENYLTEIKTLCDEYNLLLILDEVQSGMGRTGKMFAYQWEKIEPDIVTLAKGIANGLPLGATLCSERLSDKIKPGMHGSTFGGNPISISAANSVLDLLDSDQLINNYNLGNLIYNKLVNYNYPIIKSVRGKGLFIGIEFHENIKAEDVMKLLLEEKVVTCTAGNNTLRLLPPYIITEKEVLLFFNAFTKVNNILNK